METMDLKRAGQLLFLGVTLLMSTVSCQADLPLANQVQMEVDKDIMKHTIEYLRTQLITCMSQSKGVHRRKRKAHLHLHHVLEYEVEMDVLKNTRDYLTSRLVSCRQTNYRLETLPEQEKASDNSDIYESAQSLLPETLSKGNLDNVGHHDNRAASNQLLANHNNKYIHREGHVTRHHGGKSSEPKHKYENEFKMTALSRTINDSTSTTATSSKPTTTTEAPAAHTFVVNGRAVECGSYEESSDATSFICRNVIVDDVWRLPNFDLCLPGYNPSRWRHLAHIQSRTFTVLDLKSLCSELGKGVGLGNKVRDVKVVWDCGDTHYRLMYLSGKWTGSAEDNGFLRDLQCVFNT